VLHLGETGFGAKLLLATPGRLASDAKGKPVIMPKGSQKRGFYLKDAIDLLPGYAGMTALAANVQTVVDRLPKLEPLTQEHLNGITGKTDDEGNSPDCTLAIFFTFRFMGTDIPGAVWLISEYDAENDIAEGVLIVPPSEATSEYGSI